MKWTFDENWKVTIFRLPEFAIRRCTIFGVFASSKLLVSLTTWHPDRPSLLTCEVCPATRFKKKVIHGLLVGYTVDRTPMNIQYLGLEFPLQNMLSRDRYKTAPDLKHVPCITKKISPGPCICTRTILSSEK